MPKNDEDAVTANADAQVRIAKLREQVADAEAKRTTTLRDAHESIMAAKLAQEEERLSARLDVARESSKDATSSVKEQVKAAQATTETAEPTSDGAATSPTGEVTKDKE